MSDFSPAKISLLECLRNTKKPRGKPKTTLLSTISKQLSLMNLNYESSISAAQDREEWRKRIIEHVYKE